MDDVLMITPRWSLLSGRFAIRWGRLHWITLIVPCKFTLNQHVLYSIYNRLHLLLYVCTFIVFSIISWGMKSAFEMLYNLLAKAMPAQLITTLRLPNRLGIELTASLTCSNDETYDRCIIKIQAFFDKTDINRAELHIFFSKFINDFVSIFFFVVEKIDI